MIRITEIPKRNSRVIPNQPAVVYGEKKFTFKEWNERLCKVANAMYSLGVKKGDRVSLLMWKCSGEQVELQWGCIKGGIVCQFATPVPMVVKAEEVVPYVLNAVESTILFHDSYYKDLVDSIKPMLKTVKNFINTDEPDYERLVSLAPLTEPGYSSEDSDLLALSNTTGTVGLPKIVMFNQRQLDASMWTMYTKWVFPSPETKKFLFATPLYWSQMNWYLLLCAHANFATVYCAGEATPKNVLEIIDREKITTTFVSPMLLNEIAQYPDLDKYDITSLNRIGCLGTWPKETWKKITKTVGKKVIARGGGQVETGFGVALFPEDYEVEGPKERLLDSFGTDTWGVEGAVSIMDEKGNHCAEGEVGEIVQNFGPFLFTGYWRDPEKTKAVFYDDWFHTGDVGRFEVVDGKRYFWILGKKEDMVITKDKIVVPIEVERVITSHPGVKDAGICGIPDKELGEAVVASVVLKEGEKVTAEEIRELCQSKLPTYSVPKYIDFVESIPRTYKGYIISRQLKEEVMKKHGV